MHDACVRNAYPIMRSVVYSASCLFILQSYAEPKNNHQALALNAVGNIGFYSFLTPNVLMKWSSFKVRQKVVPNLFRLEAKAARISGLKGGSPPEFLAARSGPEYCPGSRIEIRRTPLLYYTWRACDGLHRCRWPQPRHRTPH